MSQAALRPLSTGEILDQAFGLYRRYFAVLVTIAIICLLLPLVASAYIGVTALARMQAQIAAHLQPEVFTWQFIVVAIAFSILSAISFGASTLVLSEGYLGRTIGTGEALRRAWDRILSLIGISLQTSLAVGLAAILLIIPGIIVGCGYAVATQALMVEPGLKLQGAMSRSWALTKGSRWRVFAAVAVGFVILLVATLGVGAVIAGVGYLAGWSGGAGFEARSQGFELVAQAANIVVRIVVMPLFTCILTVLYFDLRVRSEGFDLEALAAALSGS